MASAADRAAILAVSCSWCGAAPGEECAVRDHRHDQHRGTRRYTPIPVTTLDGGAHDARWRAALQRPAEVLTTAVPHPDPENASQGNLVASEAPSEYAHA